MENYNYIVGTSFGGILRGGREPEGGEVEAGDEELVKRAKSGDSSAFEELFLRYNRKVFSYLLGVTQNYAEAEELCQDVFMLAFKNIGSFKGRSSFYTWIFRIAINRSRDRFRKARREPVTLAVRVEKEEGAELPALENIPAATGRDAETSLIETRETIANALSKIPEKYRIPLILNAYEEMTYEEISKLLRLPVGTVKSRICRARIQLAELLSDEGIS